jgi:hypothetical protein
MGQQVPIPSATSNFADLLLPQLHMLYAQIMCTVMDGENLKNLKASSTYGAELRGYSAAAVLRKTRRPQTTLTLFAGHRAPAQAPYSTSPTEGGACCRRWPLPLAYLVYLLHK